MSQIEYFDLEPSKSDFLSDVVDGLEQKQKSIPPKYFYNEEGSKIFDDICDLDEYYPTRTECKILDRFAEDIDAALPDSCMILEYGSGSSDKIRKILSQSKKIKTYMPLDISKEHLKHSAEKIAESYPQITVKAVCADYTDSKLKSFDPGCDDTRVVFFPGSTIGNLLTKERETLLRNTKDFLGDGGLFIVGIDLIKERQTLIDAYDDKKGVTSAFNLNLLKRINQELDANFKLDQFKHEARFNEEKKRIEMHLVSQSNQKVFVGRNSFSFRQGESIHTENSHKFMVQDFLAQASHLGFGNEKVFTDDQENFAVVLMTAVS